MKLFPAIDLYGGKAVRLYQGSFDDMTVYSENPVQTALDFRRAGARCLHLVDLEGAKNGEPANGRVIREIIRAFCGFVEVGGGVRTMEAVDTYLAMGADRVILGTAAVTDPEFLRAALEKYGGRIAVGVDLKDGFAAIRGWRETSRLTAEDFFRQMEEMGVKTVICTDISRDGAMRGTNRALYASLSEQTSMDIIASGGVSSLDDVRALAAQGLSGAILGKAYYTGAVDLRQALEAAR